MRNVGSTHTESELIQEINQQRMPFVQKRCLSGAVPESHHEATAAVFSGRHVHATVRGAVRWTQVIDMCGVGKRPREQTSATPARSNPFSVLTQNLRPVATPRHTLTPSPIGRCASFRITVVGST